MVLDGEAVVFDAPAVPTSADAVLIWWAQPCFRRSFHNSTFCQRSCPAPGCRFVARQASGQRREWIRWRWQADERIIVRRGKSLKGSSREIGGRPRDAICLIPSADAGLFGRNGRNSGAPI